MSRNPKMPSAWTIEKLRQERERQEEQRPSLYIEDDYRHQPPAKPKDELQTPRGVLIIDL